MASPLSPLAALLSDELAAQRVFLSGDEATALDRPATYDDERDLAWDRVKHRRLVFYTALRERFIQERRPADLWRAMIEAQERAAGEPTFVTQIAWQVLEWAARTSDRGAMMAGFVAKALRWLGIVLLLLGAWSWFQGLPAAALSVGAAGLGFVALGAIAGSFAGRRAAALVQAARTPHPSGSGQPADPATAG
jgi:hypothetical protein